MSDGDEKFIMAYVEEERARCVSLAAALAIGADRDFLIHCIEYSVQPLEVEARREYFAQLSPVDDLEDLM